MLCKKKMAHSEGGGDDLISLLPDAIISYILSFLQTPSAVGTSILSSRWRHIWKFTPVIIFDESWEELPDSPYDELSALKCSRIITKCLELHRSAKLEIFHVYGSIHVDSILEAQRWVEFAIERNVRKLYFRLWVLGDRNKYFELPLLLHNTKSLETLELYSFIFSPPPNFNGFCLLKDLALVDCKLSDEVIQALVSSCTLLEKLTLENCLGIANVKIAAPNLKLKYFEFADDWHCSTGLEVDAPNLVHFVFLTGWGDENQSWMQRLKIKNLHCLAEASLANNFEMSPAIETEHMKAIVAELCHVSVLTVDCCFSQAVAHCYYNIGKRCTIFQNLKRFNWSGKVRDEHDLLALVAYLGDCPSLEFVSFAVSTFSLVLAILSKNLN